MLISIQTVIYIIISILFTIWFFSDFFASWSGGNFSHGKKSGELGFQGILSIFFWIIFTLIYGGIFWW
jgi:hypothetical protein